MAMKTTIALEDDVAALVSERCRRSGKSADRVVNETLRNSMEASSSAGKPSRVITHSAKFMPGVDPYRLKDILANDELERYKRVSAQ